MKHIFSALAALMMTGTLFAASGINYDGNTLELNNAFTRSECGTMKKNVMPETSGLACSRTTPGYLWAHGDENIGDKRKIVALKPDGTLAMTVNITTKNSNRDDWEDIATGRWGDKNYVFVGAIGDNDLAFKDQYYIYYFEEPAISSGSVTVTAAEICFGYPDNKAHNTETLMYDNIEQMFYIADKVDGGICHLYKLPFRTDYGTGVQKLTEVCALGNGNVFNLCTGGDITPDGQWMAIKNKEYILLWQRQGNESLSVTATRRPQQIAAYQEEKQGEALAWADSTTFYTTSDQKKDIPIYKYVRGGNSGSGEDTIPPVVPSIDSTLKAIHEVVLTNGYYAYINEGETVIRGWYLSGTESPGVKSHKVSEGAKWAQNGNQVTVTALDGSSASYTIDIQAVTPVQYTNKTIVFDGSESSWVKGAYGFDSTKKWRFSKTDDDYSREIAGKTHVEFFLPACDTVVLTSMSSKERDVNFYINGTAVGGKTKLLIAGTALPVLQSAPFMLTVASAQSSGDGGIASLRMSRRQSTGTENTQGEEVRYTKILRGHQILILRGGKTYTLTGQEIR